jgi:hypothetical protein
MGILRPETVKLIAKEMYDYDLSDDLALAAANGAGAMMTGAGYLRAALKLDGIESSFGYPSLEAEAARIRKEPQR